MSNPHRLSYKEFAQGRRKFDKVVKRFKGLFWDEPRVSAIVLHDPPLDEVDENPILLTRFKVCPRCSRGFSPLRWSCLWCQYSRDLIAVDFSFEITPAHSDTFNAMADLLGESGIDGFYDGLWRTVVNVFEEDIRQSAGGKFHES